MNCRKVCLIRMTEKNTKTTTWPDLAIGLFDKLNERNAQIDYTFDDLAVTVPSNAGSDASHAVWKLNGTVHITTSTKKG